MAVVLHFNGMLAVALQTGGGLISQGLPADVWSAEVGGVQLLDIVDDNGGTGGKVKSGPAGRFKFTVTVADDAVPDDAMVWLDFGVGGRWPMRAMESYGPAGPKGDPGDLGGIPAADGTILAYTGGQWAAKNPVTDLGLGTADDVTTAMQNAAAAQETAQQALEAAGSGSVLPTGGTTGQALVRDTTAPTGSKWKALTPGDAGAAPVVHTHTAGQVTGLAEVATTGSYINLSDRPPAGIPASAKSVAGGVAALDADGDVVDASGSKVTGGSGASTAADITDSTAVGRAVLTAADAAAARTALSVRDASQPIDAADTIGFATVATSGDYNDLLNPPPIVMQIVKRVSGIWQERNAEALAAHFYGSAAPSVGGTGMAERDLFTLTPQDFLS